MVNHYVILYLEVEHNLLKTKVVNIMSNIVQFINAKTPGVHAYTPEMGDLKPMAQIESSLGHYGKHYYLDTPLELKGRGIELLKQYKENDFHASGQYKVGWYSYCVTLNAFCKLKTLYSISSKHLLD